MSVFIFDGVVEMDENRGRWVDEWLMIWVDVGEIE